MLTRSGVKHALIWLLLTALFGWGIGSLYGFLLLGPFVVSVLMFTYSSGKAVEMLWIVRRARKIAEKVTARGPYPVAAWATFWLVATLFFTAWLETLESPANPFPSTVFHAVFIVGLNGLFWVQRIRRLKERQ